jgi:hypothetical protein
MHIEEIPEVMVKGINPIQGKRAIIHEVVSPNPTDNQNTCDTPAIDRGSSVSRRDGT